MVEETNKPEKQAPSAAPAPAETKHEKLAEENKEAPPSPPPAEDEKPPAEELEKKEKLPEPPPSIVIYVDLHCVGCAKKIERSIMKIKGVKGVVIDMAQNQVTIRGMVEPQAISNKIMKITKRKAKLLSISPANESKPLPEVVTSEVTGLNTVELKVNMHCEACAEQLKKKILKMRGVQTAETELNSGKVTVTGTMDSNKLVEYVYRRTKKTANIVPQPDPVEPKPLDEPKPEENSAKPPKEESEIESGGGSKEEPNKQDEVVTEVINIDHEEESMKRIMNLYNYYHYQQPMYGIERTPPPLLFSDENPNACSIS